jgi:dephospho-CoA kinase
MPRSARRRPGTRRPSGPWKHGPIPVIGLIGAIGAGKSLVASALAARGAKVLDADAIGHALLDQKPAREQVTRRFGPRVLDPHPGEKGLPRIDRRALGAIVFADRAALRDLEAILHPRMRQTFQRAIARTIRQGKAPAVVLDAAILLEAGWHDLCDRIVFVDAARDHRLARLSASRGWTSETLEAREQAQWPLDRKRGLADFVVSNEADPASLRAQVDRLWPSLIQAPGARPRAGPARIPRNRAPDVPLGPPSPKPTNLEGLSNHRNLTRT